ncbi:hypothetical protein CPB86DRAFT_611938 [Serendipita vermifera]|nr:hypothetical protein CPB86DRAFT_611938 [Serendipita vermifera]
MNMTSNTTTSPQVVLPSLCFCGHSQNPGSYYCSPHCAREDALNALTLGIPHESKPAFPPLPTLPADFFKSPPRMLDHVDLDFCVNLDHGPFESGVSARQPKSTLPKVKKRKNRQMTQKDEGVTSIPESAPRSTTRSAASTAHRSKATPWKSHYQRTQGRKSVNEKSTDEPLFLVDDAEEECEKTLKEIDRRSVPDVRSDVHDRSMAIPSASDTCLVEVPVVDSSNSLLRVGSFGPIVGSAPAFTCDPTERSVTLEHQSENVLSMSDRKSEDSRNRYHRSSVSSYNSLLTSGTSRSSYTNLSGSPNPSPTKLEHSPSSPPANLKPRYGSAFGPPSEFEVPIRVEEPSFPNTGGISASYLLDKREVCSQESMIDVPSIVRSAPPERSDAAKAPWERDVNQSTLGMARSDPNTKSPKSASTGIPIIRIASPTPFLSSTKGGPLVRVSQWPPFSSAPIRPEVAMHVSKSSSTTQAYQQPISTTLLPQVGPKTVGAVVKKTTLQSKGRLPIGTTPQPFTVASPSSVTLTKKLPSNTPSSAFNMSLQCKTYTAPAYAMSARKITTKTSTKTLHTSASSKSLRAKKNEQRVRIPSMGLESEQMQKAVDDIAEVFKRSFDLSSATSEDHPGDPVQEEEDGLVILPETDDVNRSATTGSCFRLDDIPQSKLDSKMEKIIPGLDEKKEPPTNLKKVHLPIRTDDDALKTGRQEPAGLSPANTNLDTMASPIQFAERLSPSEEEKSPLSAGDTHPAYPLAFSNARPFWNASQTGTSSFAKKLDSGSGIQSPFKGLKENTSNTMFRTKRLWSNASFAETVAETDTSCTSTDEPSYATFYVVQRLKVETSSPSCVSTRFS